MSDKRSYTPRISSAPPPGSQEPPSSTRPPSAEPLKQAVLLSGPGWEYTLYPGAVLIGRDPTCRIVMDDPLVSREHARLTISVNAVLVEDLRSANGVYVNNARIFEPCQLYEGDRVLVGTTELCIFSAEPQRRKVQTKNALSSPSIGTPQVPPAAPTERAAALDVLGRLADRMLADEQPQHAERVLGDHLTKLLDGARSGLPVPETVAKGASRHALKLAHALRDGKWVNYAVELHLRAELCMAPEIVSELTYAVERARGVDHALYSFYVEWLREVAPRLGPLAQEVVAQLDDVKLPSQ